MYRKIVLLFIVAFMFFAFSSCSGNNDYYIDDKGNQYLVYRDTQGDIVINENGKLLVFTLNENNKKIKSDAGEYITEYVNFNGQVVSENKVETAEMRFKLPHNFVESRETPGYFYHPSYQGEIFISYYPEGIDDHIKIQEKNCEDLLESFGSEVYSYEKYTLNISGIECTAFSSLSTTSEYYKNAFFYYIPYDNGYYIINCNVSTDYKNKVDFDSFAKSIEFKDY